MNYRLTHLAQADISGILIWSYESFGEAAEARYAALIAAAIRDVAERSTDIGFTSHQELGDGVLTWHLAQSRGRSRGSDVRRPRHFLVCRRERDILAIGRVLHDAMDLQLHVTAGMDWS
ncbi:MAG: hypothetical protein WKF50_01520 [Nocardioides sp.]